MNFETKLQKIDQIILKLQKSDISLDEAMELYSQGIQLNNECKKELEQLELSIKTVEGKKVEI